MMSASDSALKVVWQWPALGPYHFARTKALAERPEIELTVVESFSEDDHKWKRAETQHDLRVVTLASMPMMGKRPSMKISAVLAHVLDREQPDVVVAPGYADTPALLAIFAHRCLNPSTLAVLWSESTLLDHARKRFKEALKTLSVSAFDGALVAGRPHQLYLRRLGMRASDIGIVGNCVDNDFFSVRATEERQKPKTSSGSDSLPASFFLYVGRMIREKNLPNLIEAYGFYREQAGPSAWDLVLVGSGPEEMSLRQQVAQSSIKGVWFEGIRQIDELPLYYARAKCFVLPSKSEPWGLVVNEAMASGLPVLVSNRCGCVADLVRDGTNGFVFDPFDTRSLAALLVKVSTRRVALEELGANGQKTVANYNPTLFAERASTHLKRMYDRKMQMGSLSMFGSSD